MHILNFVTVNAESCEDAIDSAKYCINIDGCVIDYFSVNGAFDLNNPNDFKCVDESWHFNFSDVLGNEPILFKQRVLHILNKDVKPLVEYLDELRRIINNHESITPQWRLAYDIERIGVAIQGNYMIEDLVSQSKYDYEWKECGLTHIDNEPTHLVLVDFHM